MKKTFKVLLLPTEIAQPDQLIYQQIKNVYGESIDNPVLEFTTNETYIRNSVLMNSGKAATNSQSRNQFFELHIVSDDSINADDWYYCSKNDDSMNGGAMRCLVRSSCPFDKKIIASSDKSITPNSWIPESFINEYVKASKEGKPITDIDLEIGNDANIQGYPEEGGSHIKTAPDSSIVFHESKMYSREQLKDIMIRFLEFAVVPDGNPALISGRLDKWLEDNI